MQSQLYRIWTEKTLQLLQSQIDDAIAGWSEQWFISTLPMFNPSLVKNAYTDSSSVQHEGLFVARQTEEGHCQLFIPHSVAQQIYTRSTGDTNYKPTRDDKANKIMQNFIQKVGNNLLVKLLHNLHSDEISDPFLVKLPFTKGGGTVFVQINHPEFAMQMFLSQGIVRQLTNENKPSTNVASLVSRKAGIGQGVLKMRVTAGEVEIRLADLADLAPGQVLRLNLETDQPFVLENAETQLKICDAYLGQRAGHKAVQLMN